MKTLLKLQYFLFNCYFIINYVYDYDYNYDD
jgi:hypothetical protein